MQRSSIETGKALTRLWVTFKQNSLRWNPTRLNPELQRFSLVWDFRLSDSNLQRKRSLEAGECDWHWLELCSASQTFSSSTNRLTCWTCHLSPSFPTISKLIQ